MAIRILFLLLWAALLAGVGPCNRIPGGRLGGDVADTLPRNWSFVNDLGTCALETRPADPYSVTVTCFSVGGTLYVGSMRAPSKTWTKLVLDNSQVRYEADGTVYELQAMLVDEEDERRSAWRGRRKLAGEDPTEDAEPPEDYWIFRLEPRDRDS